MSKSDAAIIVIGAILTVTTWAIRRYSLTKRSLTSSELFDSAAIGIGSAIALVQFMKNPPNYFVTNSWYELAGIILITICALTEIALIVHAIIYISRRRLK